MGPSLVEEDPGKYQEMRDPMVSGGYTLLLRTSPTQLSGTSL